MSSLGRDESICAICVILLCVGMVILIAFGLQHIWMLVIGWILGIIFGGASYRADKKWCEQRHKGVQCP